jgi:hypothetical protein
MTTTLLLTEDTIQRVAPDSEAITAARGLLKKNSFLDPGISADQTWLLGRCKGSGKQPYEVSVDLADPTNPTCRCTCPSRKFPCKHGLGLMLLYTQFPDQFSAQEPSPELLAKREKKVVREQKKAEGGEAAPRKVNKAALAKKAAAQRDGLDLLEKLVLDLVSGGQWFEQTRLDKLQRQAKQLGDAYLPGAMFVLNRLALVGREDGRIDEERLSGGADLIGQLWATVQKGRNYLEEKIAGDENQAEADAVIEDMLGKVWQLTELKEKGYWKTNLSLLELAYERIDDAARQERVESSHLIDSNDGSIYQAITYRPFKGMKQIPEQPSYTQPLRIAEAGVYPGFLNRRIRWDKGAEQAEEPKPEHLQKVYDRARPEFKAALEAFRQQLKHPLAPRQAVVLLRCEKIGKVGDAVVLEDAAGTRIEAVDQRRDYSNVANLARAAGMLGREHPALLARLFVRPASNTVVAYPLALLSAKHHLRLGL